MDFLADLDRERRSLDRLWCLLDLETLGGDRPRDDDLGLLLRGTGDLDLAGDLETGRLRECDVGDLVRIGDFDGKDSMLDRLISSDSSLSLLSKAASFSCLI